MKRYILFCPTFKKTFKPVTDSDLPAIHYCHCQSRTAGHNYAVHLSHHYMDLFHVYESMASVKRQSLTDLHVCSKLDMLCRHGCMFKKDD